MGVLRARVGGQWVDISANTSDVVWVDTDPPTDQATELWYDTDAVGPSSAALVSGRNLLDNGQFAVKQRAATTAAANGFLADRWMCYLNGVGAMTLAYNTMVGFGVFPPAGRPRPANVQYVIVNTAEAAGALAASDFMNWQQGIEGQFLQHLNWGTADAQPVTFSADIYSTIAATYIVELSRPEATIRSISVPLAVPAGFSTQKVTFPGDVTTPISNDANLRLSCVVWQMAGSNYASGAPQSAWATQVNAGRAAGISNTFAATVNNVFSLTNAQLEIGQVATPYEVRRFDDALRHCMRYYRETARNSSLHGEGGMYGYSTAGNNMLVNFPFPVPMRAAPAYTQGGVWTAANATGPNVGTTPNSYSLAWVVSATGTFYAYSNNNGYLIFSAEI